MKVGTVTGPLLNGVAAQLESLGYDTVLFTDNQGLLPRCGPRWDSLRPKRRESCSGRG